MDIRSGRASGLQPGECLARVETADHEWPARSSEQDHGIGSYAARRLVRREQAAPSLEPSAEIDGAGWLRAATRRFQADGELVDMGEVGEVLDQQAAFLSRV